MPKLSSPSMPFLNVRLLRRIQRAILSEPILFKMEDWFSNIYDKECNRCDTAACIAGWATTFVAKKRKPVGHKIDYPIESGCQALFGHTRIMSHPANKLFFVSRWPDEFYYRHENALTPADRAQVASDYIDYFILNWPKISAKSSIKDQD